MRKQSCQNPASCSQNLVFKTGKRLDYFQPVYFFSSLFLVNRNKSSCFRQTTAFPLSPWVQNPAFKLSDEETITGSVQADWNITSTTNPPPTPSVLKTHTITVFSAAAVTQLIEQGFYSPIIILKTSQALKQQEDDWWFRQSYWQTQAAPQPLHRGRGAGRRVIHYTSQHLGGGREKGGGQTTGKQQNTNIISTVPK